MIRNKKQKYMLEINKIREGLGDRSLVFVGLMGSGKTTTGQKISRILGLRFLDSDLEIERVSGMSVAVFFSVYGEQKFRILEQQVIARLMADGPIVLATGGGAYMHPDTRNFVREYGLSVWLKADIDLLMERVSHNNGRPLLQTVDPYGVMQRLIDERYTIYAEADMVVEVGKKGKNEIVSDVLKKIDNYLMLKQGICIK